VPNRIKGQEVSVAVVSATQGLEPAFTDVKSFNFQYDRSTSSEGYLGQTSNQADDIFEGISGDIEFHSRTADVLSLFQRMNEVSKRRLPGESIQIVFTMQFPTGGSRRVVIPDCKFGNIPINIPDRASFVTFKLEYKADNATVIPAP